MKRVKLVLGAIIAWGSLSVGAQVVIGVDPALPYGSFAGSTLGSINRQSIQMQHPMGFPDLYVVPYSYGWAIDYKGVVEFWVDSLSVHNNNRGGTTPWGNPAELWIGNNTDTGGLLLRGVQEFDQQGVEVNAYGEISSRRFGGASHGDLRYVVKGQEDAHEWYIGEEAVMRLTTDGLWIKSNGAWQKVTGCTQ